MERMPILNSAEATSVVLTYRPRDCLLCNDGADQSGSGHKAVKRPPTTVPGRRVHAENSGRLTRLKRNIEAIERVGEPVTERLDEGFLTGPAREEREGLVARVEGAVGLALTPGKHAGCDVVGVGNHPHGFDVDSDLAPEGKRVDGSCASASGHGFSGIQCCGVPHGRSCGGWVVQISDWEGTRAPVSVPVASTPHTVCVHHVAAAAT